jgi:ElaB/YqjD/DUF883 family membrane-anchored ribosome-binding protein
MNYFKLAVYAAAGVGTYEILRRYGLLQKAGQWLNEQVPDEYKDQARDVANQVRERANQVAGQVRERAKDVGAQLRERAQQYGDKAHHAAESATNAVRQATGHGQDAQPAGATVTGGTGSNGQNLTGPGRGETVATDEVDGGHVSHKVGRGVVM